MRRVAITGAGCITALGIGVETFQQNLFAGRDGFHLIPGIPAGELRFSHAAQVLDFDASAHLTPEQAQLSERSSRFALAAAREAVHQSGVLAGLDGSRAAVVLGCSTGGRSAEEPETAKLYLQKSRVHPLTVPRAMASAGTSLVCIEHGITGPAFTVSTACSSATHAIGQAFHMVRSGVVDAAITGGHEAPLTYGFLKAWDSLRVVSSTRCRPFAQDRDGMTLGEGSAVLVLEDMDTAVARGADILGEIVGFGMSCDAAHMTQPKPEGPAAAINMALRDCGDLRARVEYINAHGTGTVANDAAEAAAIRSVFGADVNDIAVSSTKSMHGHAMGASGAIEALATVMALRCGLLPINAGIECADPALGIDVVTTQPRRKRASMALSNSFAFGGLNAVLAFRPYGD